MLRISRRICYDPSTRVSQRSKSSGGISMGKQRRRFLKTAAGLTAGFVMMCDPDAEAEAALGAHPGQAPAAAGEGALPMIQLGKTATRISTTC
jgi:hypothetical protein